MSEHFRTLCTLGTSNILGIFVRICMNQAGWLHIFLDQRVHHTLRDATTGARCNVPPPCQRRVAGNAFFYVLHGGCAARANCLCEMTTNRRMHKKKNNGKTTPLEKHDHNQPAPTRMHTTSYEHMPTKINATTEKHMRNERHRNAERYGQTRVTFHQRRSRTAHMHQARL